MNRKYRSGHSKCSFFQETSQVKRGSQSPGRVLTAKGFGQCYELSGRSQLTNRS